MPNLHIGERKSKDKRGKKDKGKGNKANEDGEREREDRTSDSLPPPIHCDRLDSTHSNNFIDLNSCFECLAREEHRDVIRKRHRRNCGLIPPKRNAVLIDQELFEVPCYVVGGDGRPRRSDSESWDGGTRLRARSFQEQIQRMNIRTVDIDLFRQIEVWNIIIARAYIF